MNYRQRSYLMPWNGADASYGDKRKKQRTLFLSTQVRIRERSLVTSLFLCQLHGDEQTIWTTVCSIQWLSIEELGEASPERGTRRATGI